MKRKHSELIKAWADGAIIQIKLINEWVDTYNNMPGWHDLNEYRIKPEFELNGKTL